MSNSLPFTQLRTKPFTFQSMRFGNRDVQIKAFLSIETPDGAELHHHLIIGSLEDKARIKNSMIISHVMMMLFCEEHNADVISAVHCFSICNCSAYSDAELEEIFLEAFNDYMYPLQMEILCSNWTIRTSTQIRNSIKSDIQHISANFQMSSDTCNHQHLLLTSIENIHAKLLNNHLYLGCAPTSSGYYFNMLYTSNPVPAAPRCVFPGCYDLECIVQECIVPGCGFPGCTCSGHIVLEYTFPVYIVPEHTVPRHTAPRPTVPVCPYNQMR